MTLSFSKEKITSQEIKALTGWTDSTIRHDFWLMDLKKGVSNGYFTAELKAELEEKGNHLDRAIALKRGNFINEMLQYLPTIPAQKRQELLDKLKPAEIEIPENLLEIFEKFPEVFCENSVAEVPVIGRIEGELISGQIDRLAVTEKEVMIVDFKTNRFVPTKPPENYQKQLEAYRDLIKNIFPDKIVKSYLLWTENLSLVEVK